MASNQIAQDTILQIKDEDKDEAEPEDIVAETIKFHPLEGIQTLVEEFEAIPRELPELYDAIKVLDLPLSITRIILRQTFKVNLSISATILAPPKTYHQLFPPTPKVRRFQLAATRIPALSSVVNVVLRVIPS
jgi:hypothetical protein